MMGWFGNGGYGMFHGFGWIYMLLCWALIVFVIISLVRLFSPDKDRTDSAKEILKTRFAKGEISKEEYGEMKKQL